MSKGCPRNYFILALVILWVLQWGGCSTEVVSPRLPPSPPVYTEVPFPSGTDLGDIAALFTELSAPQMPAFAQSCDKDFKKLLGLTQSAEELQSGVRELVRNDPVHYHWCFYGKVLQLETDLKKESYIEERQKAVLDTFQFLAPVAKSFVSEYRDSRYLRCAVHRYQKLSEWVFFRRLELSPEGTTELVQPSNPFGLWRKSSTGFSVLEKYHILSGKSALSDNGASPGPSAAPSALAPTAPLEAAVPTEMPTRIPTSNPTLTPALTPAPTPEASTSPNLNPNPNLSPSPSPN